MNSQNETKSDESPAPALAQMGEAALKGHGVSREQALQLTHPDLPLQALYTWTDRIRERFFGKSISFCVIANARSGACSEDCRFCAQSARHRTSVEVYGLQEKDLLLQQAKALSSSGAETFGLVTSGPGVNSQELAIIGDTLSQVEASSGLRPCASLGKLTEADLARLKDKGLSRYHHNLETSREFFPNICTTHSWEERLANLRRAKAAGLEVCSGGLFGLGESWHDRIDLAITLRNEEVMSVPLNFLNPVSGTPMADQPRLSPDEALRIICLYRFLLPKTTIRVCGGRPVVLGERQTEMFRAGANAIMTGDYLTTTGISPATDRRMVETLGLTVAGPRG